jgi:hypothetical protein
MLCRGFLIEPEVLIQIRDVVRKSGDFYQGNAAAQAPGDVMQEVVHAFDAKTMAGNMDIARLLSAIPDLEGEVSESGEIHFHRIPIADEFDTFPPRPGPLTVVLVSDSDAAGHVGDRDQ